MKRFFNYIHYSLRGIYDPESDYHRIMNMNTSINTELANKSCEIQKQFVYCDLIKYTTNDVCQAPSGLGLHLLVINVNQGDVLPFSLLFFIFQQFWNQDRQTLIFNSIFLQTKWRIWFKGLILCTQQRFSLLEFFNFLILFCCRHFNGDKFLPSGQKYCNCEHYTPFCYPKTQIVYICTLLVISVYLSDLYYISIFSYVAQSHVSIYEYRRKKQNGREKSIYNRINFSIT